MKFLEGLTREIEAKKQTQENPNNLWLVAFSMFFITALIVAIISSVKVASYEIEIFSWDWTFLAPAGTLAFALTFLATDLISEIWGKTYARWTVIIGVIFRLLILFYFYFFVLNVAGAPFWTDIDQMSLERVLNSSNAIIVWGTVSLIVASFIDIQIFHYFKNKHVNRNYFWLRNNISTMPSQVINSVIFIIAIYGTQVTLAQVGMLILIQSIIKSLVAICDTPFAYLFRNFATKRKWYDWTG